MYLTYFDDSGSEPTSDLCVFGGIVIDGSKWGSTRFAVHSIVEKIGANPDTFKEFKAGELYYANGALQGLDPKMCRTAFNWLLSTLYIDKTPFIYSAVDRAALQKESLFASAHPVDVAFRMCLQQLEFWARSQHPQPANPEYPQSVTVDFEDTCLVIADECDKGLRSQMLATFRQKRWKRSLKPGDPAVNWLFHIHDSMYFGESIDSIGLQIADAANWAMHRYLRNASLDPDTITILREVAVCAMPEPEWTQHRHLFRNHADVSPSDDAEKQPSFLPRELSGGQQ